MKNLVRFIPLCVFAIGILTAAVSIAQRTEPEKPAKKMSMGEMMSACMERCNKVQASIEASRRTIETAEKSDDIETLKTALSEVDQQLAAIDENISECRGMMMNCMGMMSQMRQMMGEEHDKKEEAEPEEESR